MHLSHPPSPPPPVVQINELITEEHFHKVFDQFGNVEDVSIKESTLDKVLPTFTFQLYHPSIACF